MARNDAIDSEQAPYAAALDGLRGREPIRDRVSESRPFSTAVDRPAPHGAREPAQAEDDLSLGDDPTLIDRVRAEASESRAAKLARRTARRVARWLGGS